MKVGWLCTAGPAPHRQETAPTHPHFCLSGSQPVPRNTSDPDDPRPPRCRQLPTHAGPRYPARCSASGSLCNTPAPTRAPPPPEEAHSVLKKPVYTAALGGGVCRTGKKEGAGAGAQQGWGPPVGHQPGHAGLQGMGQGVRGCPSPSGQQVAPEGTGSGRRPGSGLLSPGLELGPLVAL